MDVNVTIDSVVVETSIDQVAVETSLQSPIVSVTNTIGEVSVNSPTPPDINVLGVGEVTIDAGVEFSSINIELTGPPGPPGIGGGSDKEFSTANLTINIPSGQGNSSLGLSKQFYILGYTASVAGVRIRGYADSAHRTYDASRPIDEVPLLNGGVLFELVTEVGEFKFSKAVPVYAETSMPLLIESVLGLPINTTVTFFLF